MALDRAVCAAHAAGDAPPTLRLYRWTRPTVSLGRFQDISGVDLAVCAAEGIDVVRRPTGGRGVLHDDELTYAVIAGVRDGVPKGVAASYRYLCAALVASYSRLGVGAHLTHGKTGDATSAACYLLSTQADLTLGAAKLSGSAQVWDADTVLQHGSFVVSRDTAMEARVFHLDAETEAQLATGTATLESAGVGRPDDDAFTTAVIGGFESALGVNLQAGSYSPGELEQASSLLDEVFLAGVAPSI